MSNVKQYEKERKLFYQHHMNKTESFFLCPHFITHSVHKMEKFFLYDILWKFKDEFSFEMVTKRKSVAKFDDDEK